MLFFDVVSKYTSIWEGDTVSNYIWIGLFCFQDLPLFDTEPASALSGSGGSRFSRWFQGDSSVGASIFGTLGSWGGSRRSSINEGEFGYLNGTQVFMNSYVCWCYQNNLVVCASNDVCLTFVQTFETTDICNLDSAPAWCAALIWLPQQKFRQTLPTKVWMPVGTILSAHNIPHYIWFVKIKWNKSECICMFRFSWSQKSVTRTVAATRSSTESLH